MHEINEGLKTDQGQNAAAAISPKQSLRTALHRYEKGNRDNLVCPMAEPQDCIEQRKH